MSTRAPETVRPLPDDAGRSPLRQDPPSGPPWDAVAQPSQIAVPVLAVSVAAFLSVAAAAIMAGGLFRSPLSIGSGLLGAGIGVAMAGFSYKSRYPTLVQYLILPVAVMVGIVVMAADEASGGNLLKQVVDAVRSGGLAKPPIPFDTGWRFVLVVLGALAGAAACSLGVGLARPSLAVALPVPLMISAGLLRPKEGVLGPTLFALVLTGVALAVSYGADLARRGATSGRFEVRRLLRAAVLLAAVTGALVVLASIAPAKLLFPEAKGGESTPAARPEVQGLQSDRLLFKVDSDRPGPWRMGVLDVYQDGQWLLPPTDPKRMRQVKRGRVPGITSGAESYRAKFTIGAIGGHVIPSLPNPESISVEGTAVEYDPRTNILRLAEKQAPPGLVYSVLSAEAPEPEQLAVAARAPERLRAFLNAPPPPESVRKIIETAPQTSDWDRLRHARRLFFQAVVASGQGKPVRVTPARVTEILSGKPATPFEITAAEALLARWAGVPARIGYGFLGGDQANPASTQWEVHPRHGSTWLEAYFEGHGWVVLVGTPSKAKASLSQGAKQQSAGIQAAEDLALVVYVPYKVTGTKALYELIRYWVAVTAPVAAAVVFAFLLYPGLLKAVRSVMRRRWASQRGHAIRIATAYAAFRDIALDLDIGSGGSTPLEFLEAIEPDEEHTQLAWLVTRALWMDLRRDLRESDAEVAEQLARSVSRRLLKAQTISARIVAFASRSSLRQPYAAEIPNLWPSRGLRPGQALRTRLRRLTRKLVPVGAVLLAVVASGCAPESVSPQTGRPALPARIAPSRLAELSFQREPKAERPFRSAGRDAVIADGRVFSIRNEGEVQGYLQVSNFKPGLSANQPVIRDGVVNGIGGRFEPRRLDSERVWVSRSGGQRLYLWFPPGGGYFNLMVARESFDDPDRFFTAIVAYQQGLDEASALSRSSPQLLDPRRGGEL